MTRKLWLLAGSLLAGLLITINTQAQDLGFTADDLPEGVEALTRGPIHEAFAAPVTGDPEPGLVITRVSSRGGRRGVD
jgi:hypothetical protein